MTAEHSENAKLRRWEFNMQSWVSAAYATCVLTGNLRLVTNCYII